MLSPTNCSQMVWIHTTSILAIVMSILDASQRYEIAYVVRKPMSRYLLAFIVETTISVSIKIPLPVPTSVISH